MSGKVHDRISQFNNTEAISNCYVAFLGVMKKNGNYNNSHIDHSSKIVIKN